MCVLEVAVRCQLLATIVHQRAHRLTLCLLTHVSVRGVCYNAPLSPLGLWGETVLMGGDTKPGIR